MHISSRTRMMSPRLGLIVSMVLTSASCGGGASAPLETGGTPGVGGGAGGDAGGAVPTSNGGASESGGVGGGGGATSAGGMISDGGAKEAGGTTTGGGGGATPSGGAMASGGKAGSPGEMGTGGASVGDAPCDILQAAGLTCVAAHSPVRKLYGKYNGPLYQLCKGAHVAGPDSCTSGVTKDIGIVAGGYADAAAQNAFCAGATCTISIIYDQTESGNDLTPGPPGSYRPMPDNPVNASDLKVSLNGHSVYGLKINGGMGTASSTPRKWRWETIRRPSTRSPAPIT